MKCVYKIVCRDTNIKEFYIGSSVNLKNRIYLHKSQCNNLNSKDYCSPVYMFINVNGGFDNWEFEVIKEYNLISKKELELNEQAYIDLLQPHLNDRNAEGWDLKRITKNHIKKVICPNCNKKMIRTSLYRHIKTQH